MHILIRWLFFFVINQSSLGANRSVESWSACEHMPKTFLLFFDGVSACEGRRPRAHFWYYQEDSAIVSKTGRQHALAGCCSLLLSFRSAWLWDSTHYSFVFGVLSRFLYTNILLFLSVQLEIQSHSSVKLWHRWLSLVQVSYFWIESPQAPESLTDTRRDIRNEWK